jgi:L1 cell adhesion molecule like protein
MNESEDFLELVVTGHIIACAMEILNMSSITDIPSSTVIDSPEEVWMMDDNDRKSILNDIASRVVENYVDLCTRFAETKQRRSADGVHAYACEILSLGLLYLEFKDSIRENDGDRIFIVWQYLLLLFKAAKRTNYSVEAFTMLSQYHLILPPHLAEQLKWSRCVNTHGLPGHNISCNLHMEHLNRVAKVAIEGLGHNKSKKAIERVGKAIGTITSSLDKFDSTNNVPAESGHHSTRSSYKDLLKVVNQLVKSKVFKVRPGRKHKSFRKIQTNYISTLSEKRLKEWMVDHYATLSLSSYS